MPDITISSDVKGVNWGTLGVAQIARLDAAVRAAALGIEKAAKVSIQTGPKTGRITRSKKPGGKPHQASAPGEAPATDTGTLVNSIQARRKARLEWWVTVGAEYGAGLEFGKARVEPRPFMRPAVRKIEPLFREACRQAMRPKP